MSYELILGRFPDEAEKAPIVVERYNEVQSDLGVVEAAAIVKPSEDEEPTVTFMGQDLKRATKIGAAAGAVIGLLAGPVGAAIGGAAGAGTGRLLSKLSHSGFSKEMLEEVERGMAAPSSAVLLIVEYERRHLILNDLKEQGATIKRQTVESHQVEQASMIQPSSGISQR